MMKARRKAETFKVPTLVNMVKDLYDEGKSVVVFVNFTDSISAISARLENDKRFKGKNLIGYIHGNQTIRQRYAHVNDFQANRKRIMICNIAAGGVAVNLHDLDGKFPRAAILCPSFSAIQVKQALGRTFRAKGKSPVYQRMVFAARTIEERACARCQARIDNIDVLNDGDLTSGFSFFSGRMNSLVA
jgi:SNF2 family DNA or RNA helicase